MGRSGITRCSMWRGYKVVFQPILMAAILDLCELKKYSRRIRCHHPESVSRDPNVLKNAIISTTSFLRGPTSILLDYR